MVRRSIFNRACVGKPESGNATVFCAKMGVMVPGVPYVDRENWGQERNIARDRIRCFTQNVLPSISSYMFISHTKMPIFFRKGRSSTYILERQPGKLMLETFSWDNNWANHGTDKNRQSMTSCGNCCYYLERSKINHIAIKWTKYENVDGRATLEDGIAESRNGGKYPKS